MAVIGKSAAVTVANKLDWHSPLEYFAGGFQQGLSITHVTSLHSRLSEFTNRPAIAHPNARDYTKQCSGNLPQLPLLLLALAASFQSYSRIAIKKKRAIHGTEEPRSQIYFLVLAALSLALSTFLLKRSHVGGRLLLLKEGPGGPGVLKL